MNSAFKSSLITALVFIVGGYFLLSHENKTSKSLSRLSTIGEARGMVTRCFISSHDNVVVTRDCISDGFETMLDTPMAADTMNGAENES